MSQPTPDGVTDRRDPRQFVRQSLVSGTAIVLPVLFTAVVLLFAVDFLSSLLDPLAIPIGEALGTSSGGGEMLPDLIALVVLVATIMLVGAVSESSPEGNRLEDGVNTAMSRLPGISSIYGPLDRISEMLLESDTDNFQEVVLVEYPTADSYSVAFKTAEPPGRIQDAVHHDDMITVFMPMGPNPFMGGFILHMGQERVHDVDLSVEEGITSVVSFGAAIEADEVKGATDDGDIADRLERYGTDR